MEKLTKADLIEEIIRIKKLHRDVLRDLRLCKLMQEVFAEHGVSATNEPDFIELDRIKLEEQPYEVLEMAYDDLIKITEEETEEVYMLWNKLNESYENKSDDEIKAMINGYFDKCSTSEEAATMFLVDLSQEAIKLMD